MARSSSRPATTYQSKIDGWLVGVMAAALTAGVVGAMVGAMHEGPLRMAQAMAILLGVTGFLAWIFLTTNYTLDGRDLLIRSGPFSWRIPVDDIQSVEKPTGFLRSRSSPALSMDRLAIRYGRNKRIMISPADKDKFLADLRSRQSRA